jgi:hypothetical protein
MTMMTSAMPISYGICLSKQQSLAKLAGGEAPIVAQEGAMRQRMLNCVQWAGPTHTSTLLFRVPRSSFAWGGCSVVTDGFFIGN